MYVISHVDPSRMHYQNLPKIKNTIHLPRCTTIFTMSSTEWRAKAPYDPPPGREDLNDRGGRPPTEATTRSRAPPFWPGLGPPIDGFGFARHPEDVRRTWTGQGVDRSRRAP